MSWYRSSKNPSGPTFPVSLRLGGGDDTNVGPLRVLATQWIEESVPQHPDQPLLKPRRHGIQIVDIQRAACRQSDPARFVVSCLSFAVGGVSKDLGFQQGLGQYLAADGNEWAALPQAHGMDGLGDMLLPGAPLAFQKDRHLHFGGRFSASNTNGASFRFY